VDDAGGALDAIGQVAMVLGELKIGVHLPHDRGLDAAPGERASAIARGSMARSIIATPHATRAGHAARRRSPASATPMLTTVSAPS